MGCLLILLYGMFINAFLWRVYMVYVLMEGDVTIFFVSVVHFVPTFWWTNMDKNR